MSDLIAQLSAAIEPFCGSGAHSNSITLIWMMTAIPAAIGLGTFFISHAWLRNFLLRFCAVLHAGLTVVAWNLPMDSSDSNWVGFDPLSLLIVSATSVVFLAAALLTPVYLSRHVHKEESEDMFGDDEPRFVHAPDSVFLACMELFLSMMTLVCVSRHFGLMWIAVEATTLVSAPLIYYNKTRKSLAATWKYILICSVGIGISLIGNLMLTLASLPGHAPLTIDALTAVGHNLQPVWLQAAFIFFLVGYGTKAGLAPFHTWLPNAHGEAPSIVSAMLSGALLNCALLGVLRAHQVCVSAGQGAFSSGLLVFFGMLSIAMATVFLFMQKDYKRALAYSSVENIGIIALGVGVGGCAVLGAMLHIVNHSLVKSSMFLSAGNILALFKSKSVSNVRGLWTSFPKIGAAWTAGFIALAGLPPFGLFISKFTIFKGAVENERYIVAIVFMALLCLIFIAISRIFLGMSQGEASPHSSSAPKLTILELTIPCVLLAASICLGIYIPDFLLDLILDIRIMLMGQV